MSATASTQHAPPRFQQDQQVICRHPALGLKQDAVYEIDAIWGPNPRSWNYYLKGDTNVIPYKEERFEEYHGTE